jgi:glycerol-3-phosphate dehydrogenase
MPLTRDLAAVSAHRYDLLVVGGGIHGLFAAYDAAQRGLSVALVERGDFGGGLSFNHQRTIHGGLRALQSGNVGKTREQIRERRTWARIAPHLLRPLPFLVGTYRWSKRSRTIMRVGFRVYDAIGRSRNAGVSPELHIPKARLESAAATKRLFPGVAASGLSGGAIWYDYQTSHADRLTWTAALAAVNAGAALFNYVETIAPLREGGNVVGARVRDVLSGTEHDIQAARTLLAVGGALKSTLTEFGSDGAPPLLAAMNVLIDHRARDIALVAPSASGRMLTAVPWRGRVLAGTFQFDAPANAGAHAPAALVDRSLEELRRAFPTLATTRDGVRLVHYGLVPAAMRASGFDLLSESRVIRHRDTGAPGLLSLVGVKYTTSRLAAERAVDAVAQDLGKHTTRCKTAVLTLPHAGIADVEGRLLETARDRDIALDRDQIEHLAAWYGTEASEVLHAGDHDRALLTRLSPDTPIVAAEIIHAIERAQAIRLSDVVLRRTPLGSAGHPGAAALQSAADLMAARLGWSAQRRADEIAQVEDTYALT